MALGVGLVGGIAVGAMGTQVLNAQTGPLRNTELLKTDLVRIKGKEGVVVLSELAPGAIAGRHYPSR